MRRMLFAFALVAPVSVASAQGQPFAFTVPVPDARFQAIVRSSAGYGDALGVEQSAELDIPIGSRFFVLGSTGVAYPGPGALQSMAQIDALVDAFHFGGWHLAVSGGVRRHFDNSNVGIGRVIFSQTTANWSVAANVDVEKTVQGGYWAPYRWMTGNASFGASAKVAQWVSLGGETMASYSRAVTTVFVGPLVSFALPVHRARLDLGGGPIVVASGDPFLLPDYTIVGKYVMPFPAHSSGYTLRLALSVGF